MNIHTRKAKVMYKGDIYELEVDGSQLLSVQDEEGNEVYNPHTFHNLQYCWKNGLIEY